MKWTVQVLKPKNLEEKPTEGVKKRPDGVVGTLSNLTWQTDRNRKMKEHELTDTWMQIGIGDSLQYLTARSENNYTELSRH
jgi:hypothetical protein